MKIIQINPNPSGAYPSPNNWGNQTPPNGYAVIADTVDMADFYAYNGFVTLTIEQTKVGEAISFDEENEPITPIYADTVTAYTPNIEAWEAWKASLPAPSEPEPTTEDRITALEEQLAQSDDVAIALFEAQAVQEEINMAQDDALIEIYEMIGGLM